MNCPPGSWVLGVSGHGGDGVTPQTRVPSALVGEAQVMGSTGGVYLTHHWHLGDPGVAGLVQSYSGGGAGRGQWPWGHMEGAGGAGVADVGAWSPHAGSGPCPRQTRHAGRLRPQNRTL